MKIKIAAERLARLYHLTEIAAEGGHAIISAANKVFDEGANI